MSQSICTSCGAGNPQQARFCGACGAGLAVQLSCPNCGAAADAGQRFCNECGSELVSTAADSAVEQAKFERTAMTPEHLARKIDAARGQIEGERKNVTVLFADLKGSMDLAQSVDTEQWQAIIDRFFSILCEGVHRYEGQVNKFTGDGVMALFGAPIAHEDHAQRACFAALHLIDELERFAVELRREEGINFSVRMGINSGEVVLGTIGENHNVDYTAIGHTVGLAQRVEQLAAPGRAYLTRGTATLVEGYFDLADLGPFKLKGVESEVNVFELRGIGAARGRLDVSLRRGLSRFVGRESEMEAMQQALAQTLDGNGQLVGVVGEPGVGKSRLCFEFKQACRRQDVEVIEGRAFAHTQGIPMALMTDMMRDYFAISDRDKAHVAREKIAGRMLLLDDAFAESLPLVFDFFGVADPENPPPAIDADARARQLVEIGRRLIYARSLQRPAVYVLEDMHWSDEASRAFLLTLIDALPGTRTLVVANFRPEFEAEWMRRSFYRQLPMLPLGPTAIEELLRARLGDDDSLAPLIEQIKARTAGNPFFAEEVAQQAIESGVLAGGEGAYRLVDQEADVDVPASVQDLLAARIDRLEPREKQVLQAASVVGRHCPARVIERIAHLPAVELSAALRALSDAELLYEEAVYPEVEYTFKHPLTHEVAYKTQLRDRRQRMHREVAEALEVLNADRLDEIAAIVAQHYESAGEQLAAARWYKRAAQAGGTIDHSETARYWQRVRELAGEVGENEAALDLVAEACLLVMTVEGWRMGMPASELEAVYEQGRAAAQARDDCSRLAELQMGYGFVRYMIGDGIGGLKLMEEAWSFDQATPEPVLYSDSGGYFYALFLAGRVEQSLAIADETIEALGASRHEKNMFGLNMYAFAVMFRIYALGECGRIAEAVDGFDEALAFARDVDDLEVLGWAHGTYAAVAAFTGEGEKAIEHTQRSVEIAEQVGSNFSRALALSTMGSALVTSGRPEEAIAVLEGALAGLREHGTNMERESQWNAYLAGARLGVGEVAGAIEAGRLATRIAEDRGQRLVEVTAKIVLALALLADGSPAAIDEAESRLDEVRQIASECGLVTRVAQAELAGLVVEMRRGGDVADRLRAARDRCAELGDAVSAGRATALIGS